MNTSFNIWPIYMYSHSSVIFITFLCIPVSRCIFRLLGNECNFSFLENDHVGRFSSNQLKCYLLMCWNSGRAFPAWMFLATATRDFGRQLCYLNKLYRNLFEEAKMSLLGFFIESAGIPKRFKVYSKLKIDTAIKFPKACGFIRADPWFNTLME